MRVGEDGRSVSGWTWQTPLVHEAALPSLWASELLVNSVLPCGHDMKHQGPGGTKQGGMSGFQILSLPGIFFHFVSVIQFVGIEHFIAFPYLSFL